jgi:tripartite-type tricarboxylate transporter receptor subunit TctC
MKRRTLVQLALAAAAAALGPAAALAQAQVPAQAYPTKPVKMLVGFAPGGSADIVARLIADQLTARLGQPFMVENRTGANGMLAAEGAARSDPDGYTIFVSNSSTVTLNPTLFKDLRYNPTTDFTPLTNIVTVSMLMVVNPEAPLTANVKTVADLVDLAKKRPGEITYGSAGVGNITQLGFEWFSDSAGIKLTHVPYRGVAGTQAALMAKEVAVVLDSPAGIQHVKSGKFRALAVTGPSRMAELPDVPTMQELGYKDYDIGYWVGFFMRAGTPQPIIDKLNAEIAEIAKIPDVQAKLKLQGNPAVEGQKAFGESVKRETERLAAIVKKANIKVEQ